MSSADYWKKRETEQKKHNIADEEEYAKRIKEIYEDMTENVQKEIDAFYTKYAKKKGISLAEAKKRVSELDIKAYERKAKKYVKEAAKDRKANKGKTNYEGDYFSKEANDEMEIYNLTMKVNRLEMLKANIGLELIKGHDELQQFMDEILQGRTMAELERQAGILGKTVRNNAKTARAIVNASFHNATYSDRIWTYQNVLKSELSYLLQKGLMMGKNPRVLAKELRKRFEVTESEAERLMRTELSRVQTEAQKQSFIENGFTQYTFLALGDACGDCKRIDGNHYDIEKMMPGENAPPMHPNCRCSIAAYEDDDEYEAWLDYLASGAGTSEDYENYKAWTARKTSSMRRDPAKFRQRQTTVAEETQGFQKAKTQAEAATIGKNLTKSGEFTTEGLHLNTVNGFMEAMHKVKERFGQLLNIKGVKAVKTADAKYHQGSYDPISKIVSLKGGKSASALSTYSKNAEKFFANGWNASKDPYGTFYHEIGHSIWDDLPEEARYELRSIYRKTKHDAYEKWMEMGGSRSGKSQADVFGKELSRYSIENEQEFFSEAFSQIMSGRMRPVSRQVNEVLNKYYKK